MKTVTTEQMRNLERKVIEDYNIPGEELMARAGDGTAEVICRLSERCGMAHPFVLLMAGRGNNGGDAFAAAHCLHDEGMDAEVWLAGSAGDIRGDALRHLGKMRASGVTLRELPTVEAWEEALAQAEPADLLVDGILGIGASGPARGPIAGAIHTINTLSQESLVISIDVPSGLDADTGTSAGETVCADITATMGLPKIGMLTAAALESVGRLEVIDIGIPWELTRDFKSDPELITGWEVRQLFPRRRRDSHKGTYGHVLIIAGSLGYAGAAILAAQSACRSGVGLVSLLVPQSIAAIVAGAVPQAMVHAAPTAGKGHLAATALIGLPRGLAPFDAIVIGPGVTTAPDIRALIDQLISLCKAPLVLDADALTVYAGQLEALQAASGPLVLTPHPGEMARLLGQDTAWVQANRDQAVRQAADRARGVAVLKGAATLVATADRPVGLNLTGNPGMATGGTGDVLTGLLGGFLAQGIKPFEAACAAVSIHGRAGDYASWRRSQMGMTASDVIEEIPYIFREMLLR
jgi:NAD(P)H-hydrate epimerase